MDMPRHHARLTATLAAILALAATAPLTAAAEQASDALARADGLSAYLDGRRIKPEEVGNWYCQDFAYPIIECYSDPETLEDRAHSLLTAGTGDYVVIYDFTGYAGSYMYVSQNYTVLAVIGWNDRVSSMRSINAGAGNFHVDWFYGGSAYYFCCNNQYASLGGFDNTFSSVYRQ